MAKQCPLVADYKFCTQCVIKSCVNYSPRTASKCMRLDVRSISGEESITDSELLHYKFPDKDLTVKDVTRIRKRAIDRIHHWFMFHKIVSRIREMPVRAIKEKRVVRELLETKPFNLPLFKFESWMLLYLIDDKFCKSVVPLFSLKELLGYVQTDYDDFCARIKSLELEVIPCLKQLP